MGMAASQARYLALVARKSNCEYEGQQINQARTVLSNQTANLFNQMLGLSVPIPPSTQDYTKQQYSYTDGVNESTIDSWEQLASPESDYNYIVTHHYYADVYTGSQKQMNDPQVQFTGEIPTGDYSTQIAAIQAALENVQNAQAAYDEAEAEYQTLQQKISSLTYYADNSSRTNVTNSTYNPDDNSYTVTYKDAEGNEQNTTYVSYTDNPDPNVLSAVQKLVQVGALKKDAVNPDMTDVYYNAQDGTIAFASDLANLTGSITGTQTILPVYHIGGTEKPEGATWKYINEVLGDNGELAQAKAKLDSNKALLDLAEAAYDALSVPSYIGNCELTPISEPTEDQMAEINQIIKDMEAQGIDSSIANCFDVNTGEYKGGIYTFKLNGITYFTTYKDLADSAAGGTGINHIDGQPKMAYYNATYVRTKIEETEKALLETDGSGRFTSIRFGDDTITYTLNMETVTDDNAYQDAMNQYYYESAQYDKMIQDINAKTSLIQQEDQQLELRLKQLDTEQNALSTEIDAVSKVVKDNVEDSFKTFGG